MEQKEPMIKTMFDRMMEVSEEYRQWADRCCSIAGNVAVEVAKMRDTGARMAANIAMALVYLECTHDPIPDEVRKKLEMCLCGDGMLVSREEEA